MSPKPNDLNTLFNEFRTMNIEELRACIDHWEENNAHSNQRQRIDVAKKELELKYKERQEQIELLTSSLTSSSRVVRWISSIRTLLNQTLESKN